MNLIQRYIKYHAFSFPPLIAILLLPSFLTAQTSIKPVINSVVTGRVTDGNAPLEGTTVQIKGTTNTATTDFEGNFTLKTGQKLPFTLVVTYHYCPAKTGIK